MAEEPAWEAPRPRARRAASGGERRWPKRVAQGLALAMVVASMGLTTYFFRGVVDEAPVAGTCTASVGADRYALQPDQASTAGLLAAIAIQRNLPARAVSIAIATGMQESKLRNIDYGDRDSVGIFQQRPSQGWGTVAQIMDPVYSTNAFYDGLEGVRGYQDMSINDAAQAVQRSGFPHAYGKHENTARAFASALTGFSAANLNCHLGGASASGDPRAVVAALTQGFGVERAVNARVEGPKVIVIPGVAETDRPYDAVRQWAVAQWAVANAERLHLDSVEMAGMRWTRDRPWQEAVYPGSPSNVVITVHR